MPLKDRLRLMRQVCLIQLRNTFQMRRLYSPENRNRFFEGLRFHQEEKEWYWLDLDNGEIGKESLWRDNEWDAKKIDELYEGIAAKDIKKCMEWVNLAYEYLIDRKCREACKDLDKQVPKADEKKISKGWVLEQNYSDWCAQLALTQKTTIKLRTLWQVRWPERHRALHR